MTACRGKKLSVGAPELQLTDDEQHNRARKLLGAKIEVAQGKRTEAAFADLAKSEGAKDASIVLQILKYCSYKNLFLVPVAHTLLFGVVKSFITCILRNPEGAHPGTFLTKAARKTIQERGKHVGSASDFGRKYKDVVVYKASFTMEEWLHFVLTFSHYLFMGDILPPLLKEMWELLQIAVGHYCHGISFSAGAADAAAAALKKYAVMVEKNFPIGMCTYNLHIAVCRLPRQEKECGSAARVAEFIVERAMQSFKEKSGRRVSKDPEKVFCSTFFMEEAVLRLAKDYPGIRPFSELCGDAGGRIYGSACYDKAGEGETVQLVGKGKYRLGDKQKGEILEAVLTLAEKQGMKEIWSKDVVEKHLNKNPSKRKADSTSHVMVFSRGEHREDVFISESYGRCTRTNYFLQVPYIEGQERKNHYVGLVRYFVKVPYTADFPAPHALGVEPGEGSNDPVPARLPHPTALRFGIMSFFERLDSAGRVLVHDDANGAAPKLQVVSLGRVRQGETAYPVLLEEIGSKMVVTSPVGGLIYCTPYTVLTARQ